MWPRALVWWLLKAIWKYCIEQTFVAVRLWEFLSLSTRLKPRMPTSFMSRLSFSIGTSFSLPTRLSLSTLRCLAKIFVTLSLSLTGWKMLSPTSLPSAMGVARRYASRVRIFCWMCISIKIASLYRSTAPESRSTSVDIVWSRRRRLSMRCLPPD